MITVFTPTYNRKNLLSRLKISLDKQSCFNFEWIIVDDGSTDNTEELVCEWAKSSNYQIKYYKQENQGKYAAHDTGVKLASGAYFLCVDSDDVLTENAISTIENDTCNISNQNIGMVYPRADMQRKISYKWRKIKNREIDIMDIKELYGIKESTIVFKMDILKKHSFKKYFEGGGVN